MHFDFVVWIFKNKHCWCAVGTVGYLCCVTIHISFLDAICMHSRGVCWFVPNWLSNVSFLFVWWFFVWNLHVTGCRKFIIFDARPCASYFFYVQFVCPLFGHQMSADYYFGIRGKGTSFCIICKCSLYLRCCMISGLCVVVLMDY